ncbi:MAG TPA: hypothetical protein VMZ03_03660 [Chitinophagaceae bacterium]|nr:hypothetical protein [Chitinophagaceae bacterium]
MKKKKESVWQLLRRLDEEAAQFNIHLQEANRYFDNAASKTAKILTEHEREMHKTIAKLKKAIRVFAKKKKKK